MATNCVGIWAGRACYGAQPNSARTGISVFSPAPQLLSAFTAHWTNVRYKSSGSPRLIERSLAGPLETFEPPAINHQDRKGLSFRAFTIPRNEQLLSGFLALSMQAVHFRAEILEFPPPAGVFTAVMSPPLLDVCQVPLPAASEVRTLPGPAPVGIITPSCFTTPFMSIANALSRTVRSDPDTPAALIRN